jgi:hypothetical protein
MRLNWLTLLLSGLWVVCCGGSLLSRFQSFSLFRPSRSLSQKETAADRTAAVVQSLVGFDPDLQFASGNNQLKLNKFESITEYESALRQSRGLSDYLSNIGDSVFCYISTDMPLQKFLSNFQKLLDTIYAWEFSRAVDDHPISFVFVFSSEKGLQSISNFQNQLNKLIEVFNWKFPFNLIQVWV